MIIERVSAILATPHPGQKAGIAPPRGGEFVLTSNTHIMKSKFLTLDTRDIIHGIIIAFLTALLTGLIDILDKGAIFTWLTMKPVLIAGFSAALSYLLKSLLTNSRNQLFTREPV
jgi:hypothetical protein